MGGLLAILLLGLYLSLTYVVVRRAKPISLKALTVLVFVAIPTADALYGRMKLRQMCEAEGGIRIIRSVGDVRGFYEFLGPDEMWIKTYNFEFVEGGNSSGNRVNRLSVQPNGAITSEKDVERKSVYQLRVSQGDLSDLYMRTEFVVETSDRKEVLGRLVDFNFAGGWVERGLASIYARRGTGGTCNLNSYVRGLQQDLIARTLKSTRKIS